jgi:hypothetical protein
MAGRLTVESAPGRTTFSFDLPTEPERYSGAANG